MKRSSFPAEGGRQPAGVICQLAAKAWMLARACFHRSELPLPLPLPRLSLGRFSYSTLHLRLTAPWCLLYNRLLHSSRHIYFPLTRLLPTKDLLSLPYALHVSPTGSPRSVIPPSSQCEGGRGGRPLPCGPSLGLPGLLSLW